MQRRRIHRFVIAVLIAASISGITAVAIGNGWLEALRLRTSDALVFPRGDASPDVAVVAIDARTLAAYDRPWPWPRDAQADLVTAVDKAGSRVIVLDVLLAPATDGDDRLRAALQATPSVIAAGVESTTERDLQWTAEGVLIATNLITPAPRFADAALVGHSAVTPDGSDGVTREVPLVVEAERRFVPALVVAALARLDDVAPQVTVRRRSIQIGTRVIPTNSRHQLRVSYSASLSGEDDEAVVSAVDVLAGRAGDRLRDKIVFVGVTDPIAGDRHLTPIAKRSGMAGVFVHANAFHTISSATYLTTGSSTEVAAWAFVLALLIALVTMYVRPWIAAITAIVASAGFLVTVVARADRGTIVDATFPLLAVITSLLFGALAREVLVDRQRRALSALFAQYVPPEVAREVVGDARTSGILDGERLQVTVLFCDIRGFTPLTEGLEPSQIRELLDVYYTVLSDVVFHHGGTVLRYTGDEILAVFGAPVVSDDHANEAVRAAIALHDARTALNERLGAAGLPALDYGIGVQSGAVVSAVMGSAVRRQYAVIGTALTLGARLCAEARAGETVVASETFAAVDDPPHADSFSTNLKGRAQAATLFRISPRR